MGDHGRVSRVDQQSVSLEKHALTIASLLDLAIEQDIQLQDWIGLDYGRSEGLSKLWSKRVSRNLSTI
jgi:hypothetical protein